MVESIWILNLNRMTAEEAKKAKDLTDIDRVSLMSESEIEENAVADPDNQPLSIDSLKKVRRIDRK